MPSSLRLVAALFVASTALTTDVQAEVFGLRAELRGGGAGGLGLGGDVADAAFYETRPHAMAGVEIGAELVFIEAWISHQQYYGKGAIATWTTFGVGADISVDVGQRQRTFFEGGLGVGLGLATGAQVDPPLDAAQLTDRGLFATAWGAFGWHLGGRMDLGIRVPIEAGYYVKSGPGAAVNDQSTHYQAVGVEASLFLRFQLVGK